MTLVVVILILWAVMLLCWWLVQRHPNGVPSSEDATALEQVRRSWSLHRPDGSIPLGTLTQPEAVLMASKMGARVTYVDREYGLIFADTHLRSGDLEDMQD